ncbi:MAG: rhodanese-like domain-containing protein [Thermodesulfobacteriota bacterium]|nr:rhodanese-like domain-containing protein [Thermodesulfobacteriota bacterium]
MRNQLFVKKSLIVFFVLLFTLSLSASCLAGLTDKDFVKEAKKKVTEISVADAKAAMDAGKVDVILDCRTAKEFKKGHLPKAMNLQRGLLEFKATKKIPNKDASIICYCKSGGRSCLSTCTLGQMGYTNVKSLDGGWKAWLKAGYPIE